LFKSRRIVTETTRTGRLLLLTFVDVVDLYEQIIAMYYDYSDIRERFGKSAVLDAISRSIRRLSVELDHIGLAIQLPVPFHRPVDSTPELENLKRSIDALSDQDGSTLVLKKVLVTLRTISQRVSTLQKNLSSTKGNPVDNEAMEYGRFVSHQEIDLKSFRDNLTLSSLTFRYSIRVAIAMLLGFIITKLLPYGHHSYWVLLTISVILKPAFSLTKQRNVQRIVGTLAGGIIGVLVLTYFPDKHVQFGFMVLFMLGTYSAQRINYIIMVICVTPFVLILFNFLGVSYLGVAEERFFDTLLGGIIALTAGYAFFPQWESDQLVKPMKAILHANIRYLQLLLDSLSGGTISSVEYKLTRKEVYVTSANLSAAFERMLSEPKHKQRNEKLVYEFVVLNHILSANIATITSAQLANQPGCYPTTLQRPIKRALFSLTESLRRLGTTAEKPIQDSAGVPLPALPVMDNSLDPLLSDQLAFIQQVSSDIGKLVERVDK